MAEYIIIYIIVGIIAGFIGKETEERQSLSFGLMFIGALISLIMFGPFVIASIIEMAIGFGLITVIRDNMDAITEFIRKLFILVILLIIIGFFGHQVWHIW